MRYLQYISILIISFQSFGQISQYDIRVRKSMRDHLDDLVYNYQFSARLQDEESRQQFRSLFTRDAKVFDFITPNYISNKVGKEMVKPLNDFIDDVAKEFPQGFKQLNIIETNLGKAIDYNSSELRGLVLYVDIKQIVIGDYYNGGEFSNDPVLRFKVVFDTLKNQVINMKIDNISKIESRLMFMKEERTPFFEKQISSSILNSWVTTSGISFGDSRGESYFIDKPVVSTDYSYNFSIDFIRLIAAPEPEEFAFSIGISYSEINFQVSPENYFYTTVEIDKDSDRYYNSVTGYDFQEFIKLQFIEVPLRFRYEIEFTRSLAFYIHPGINLSYNFESSFSGSGIFSYTGLYPKYDVILKNLPEYGFVNDNSQAGSDKLNTSMIGVAGSLSIGINKTFKSGLMVYFGATGSKSIKNITQNNTGHLISTQMGEYAGIAPSLKSISYGGYGFQIGFRKRFESKNGLLKLEQLND